MFVIPMGFLRSLTLPARQCCCGYFAHGSGHAEPAYNPKSRRAFAVVIAASSSAGMPIAEANIADV